MHNATIQTNPITPDDHYVYCRKCDDLVAGPFPNEEIALSYCIYHEARFLALSDPEVRAMFQAMDDA